jgi:type IV secretion system protein VirB10
VSVERIDDGLIPERKGGGGYEDAAALCALDGKPAKQAKQAGGAAKNESDGLHRAKTLRIVCVVFAGVVVLSMVFTMNAKNKKRGDEERAARAAKTPKEFLARELEASLVQEGGGGRGAEGLPEIAADAEPASLPEVKAVSLSETRAAELARGRDVPPAPPPSGGGGRGGGGAPFTANRSSLVPRVEGRLFSEAAGAGAGGNGGAYADRYPYAAGSGGGVTGAAGYGAAGYGAAAFGAGADGYAAQNNQADKKAFYGSDYSGGGISGAYIGEDALWTGTVIPAVLETAVNTDLPGNVLARVSQNVYDSRTGKKLLIPQGSILVAKYNSSVSYAQRRVQIVWDLLIRPDGYQVELAGMNGVDAEGMSGAPAEYSENWFEYLKAAGIITMFSIANSKMAEEAAKYGTAETAAGVVAGNAEMVNQLGGNIVTRALNIQPTLTIENGGRVNVMLNKTIYLPPVEDVNVSEKYILK